MYGYGSPRDGSYSEALSKDRRATLSRPSRNAWRPRSSAESKSPDPRRSELQPARSPAEESAAAPSARPTRRDAAGAPPARMGGAVPRDPDVRVPGRITTHASHSAVERTRQSAGNALPNVA